MEQEAPGTSVTYTAEFYENYKKILQKLKKKLFAKPKYGEAVEDLTLLANSLKREKETHVYAAFCYLAISRCEEVMKSPALEASALMDAAYIFWQNEFETRDLNLEGFEEYYVEAVNCYLLAVKIYVNQKKNHLAAALYVEMGDILKKLNKLGEAGEFFQQAAELQQGDSPLNAIVSLEEAVHCHVKLHDYKNSCAALIWIIKLASEVSGETWVNVEDNHSTFSKVLIESRISLILLLVLQGDFQQPKDFVKALVDDMNGFSVIPAKELIKLLDMLVTLCERRDLPGIRKIQRELYRIFTANQNEILLTIVSEIEHHYRLF